MVVLRPDGMVIHFLLDLHDLVLIKNLLDMIMNNFEYADSTILFINKISDVFKGCRKKPVAWTGLDILFFIAVNEMITTEKCFDKCCLGKKVIVYLKVKRVHWYYWLFCQSSEYFNKQFGFVK